MNRIVFATGNKDKLKEVAMILKDLNMEVISIKEAGVKLDVIEDGKTYTENAMIKAKAAHELLPDDIVMADDSGFEVDYLNKEPGIYSARYLGEDTSYDIKNQNLIDRLDGVEDEKRTARFVCDIAAVLPDGRILTTEGILEGRIAHEAAGCGGFGFDPIFFLPDRGCTTAELTEDGKNEISHRGRALRAMKEVLARELGVM